MQPSPLPNEPKSGSRLDSPGEYLARKVEGCLLALMFRVEMRWHVFLVEHPDDDPEEDGYHRHGMSIPSSVNP